MWQLMTHRRRGKSEAFRNNYDKKFDDEEIEGLDSSEEFIAGVGNEGLVKMYSSKSSE